MTAAEVAQLLALPKSTVYELARRGELPCARLGRTMRCRSRVARLKVRARVASRSSWLTVSRATMASVSARSRLMRACSSANSSSEICSA